jgi:hypothetical protein
MNRWPKQQNTSGKRMYEIIRLVGLSYVIVPERSAYLMEVYLVAYLLFQHEDLLYCLFLLSKVGYYHVGLIWYGKLLSPLWTFSNRCLLLCELSY